jgi:hypothetical protein
MARSVTVARRFWLAYLGLAALFGIAVGSFIVLVERPGPAPPPPWSSWQPQADQAGSRQQEIATHIATRYKLPSGNKLVDVFVGGPTSVHDVAIARNLQPTQQDVVAFIGADQTAMYTLCGKGPQCSITEGKPTTARFDVLRREALELALYTFRYIDGPDAVVAFFPPKKGENQTFAMFFARADLKSQVDEPLNRTLPSPKAPLPGALTVTERNTLDALTAKRVFQFAVQQESNGQSVLVLAPPTS